MKKKLTRGNGFAYKVNSLFFRKNRNTLSSNYNLSPMKVRDLSNKTIDLLNEEHLYKISNLRLEKLANHVGVPSYVMSQVINRGMNTTFNDLINSYRIRDIQEQLKNQSERSKTITDMAYESGFNSKSTFFSSFKKATGVTPAVYRRSCL